MKSTFYIKGNPSFSDLYKKMEAKKKKFLPVTPPNSRGLCPGELWHCIMNIQNSYPWRPVSPLAPVLGVNYEINFREARLMEICLDIADLMFNFTTRYRPACRIVINALNNLLNTAVEEKLCYAQLRRHFNDGNCLNVKFCTQRFLSNIKNVASAFYEALTALKLAARRLCCIRPRKKASMFPSCVSIGLLSIREE